MEELFIDLSVVGIYLFIMVLIGLFESKTAAKSRESFFMGERRFNWGYSLMHMFGTGTASDHPVAIAGACYSAGYSGIWYQFNLLPITPFFWVLAPIFRRSKCLTTADFFEERFSKSFSIAYAFMGAVFYFVYIGTILQATGKVVSAATLGAVSTELSIIIMFVIFVIYGISGGLKAAVITDFIQGFMIIIFSLLLLIPVLSYVGGIHAMNEALPSSYLSMVAPHELTLGYIIALIIAQLASWPCQPHHMEICGSARNELGSRIGVTYGMIVKRFCTIAWAIVGVAGFIIYPTIANREMLFGYVIHDFLPVGITGLVIASFMAMGMSSVDSYMIDGGALMTQVYSGLRPGRDEKEYLKYGRFFSFMLALASVLFAFFLPSVVEGIKIMAEILGFTGIAWWLGVAWHRINSKGAWAGFLSSSATFLVCRSLGIGYALEVFLFLTIGIALTIIVSLLTAPENRKEFFNRIYSGEDKKEYRKLFLDIGWPKRETWIGFVVACLVTLSILGILAVIISL